MDQAFRAFIRTEPQVKSFDDFTNLQYKHEILFYDYVLTLLGRYSAFTSTVIGFREGDKNRFAIEALVFSQYFLPNVFSDYFKKLVEKMLRYKEINELLVKDAVKRNDVPNTAKYYVFYVNCIGNIGKALLNELTGKSGQPIQIDPVSESDL